MSDGRRENDQADIVSLGEVYRLLLAVDARTQLMQKAMDAESHSLRNKMNEQAIQLALLEKEVEDVEAQQSDRKNWVAAVVVGVIVMVLQQLIQHGVFH